MKSQAAQTWGKYDEQLKTKDRLLGENETIKEETKALMAQLEKEQGNLSIYHDKVYAKRHFAFSFNFLFPASKSHRRYCSCRNGT